MISVVICNSNDAERISMEKYSHDLAAYLSDEKWEIHSISDEKGLKDYLKKSPIFDIACVDLTVDNGVVYAEELRKQNKSAFIILVATVSMSPMMYLQPGIMAGSLLLRVFSEEQMKDVFEGAFRNYLEKFETESNPEDAYVVDTRNGRQRIPYSQIYYFEARDKKIVITNKSQEIYCYDTIANLENILPEQFIRCHRSFIINKKHVVKLILSQGVVELEDDIYIPISRNYKSVVKTII